MTILPRHAILKNGDSIYCMICGREMIIDKDIEMVQGKNQEYKGWLIMPALTENGFVANYKCEFHNLTYGVNSYNEEGQLM